MARTYTRDARGRFASGGGGGGRRMGPASPVRGRKQGSPPPKRHGLIPQRKAAAKSRRKLAAMNPGDKSYTGQLSRRAQKAAVTRTANRLAAAKITGRHRIKPAAVSGVIRARRSGSKPAAPRTSTGSKPAVHGRTRVRFLTLRKEGVILKKAIDALKDRTFKAGDLKGNLKAAVAFVERRGVKATVGTAKSGPASFNAKANSKVGLYNPSIRLSSKVGHWEDPAKSGAYHRGVRFWSSAAPLHALHHEIGHSKYYQQRPGAAGLSRIRLNANQFRPVTHILGGRVSRYAATSPEEFVAETYAGLRTGHRYDKNVMNTYRALMGSGDPSLRARYSRRGRPR